MYNQALQSEFHKNIELAAVGYRSALEILIKDYAVNELGLNPEEVSSKNFVLQSEHISIKKIL